MNILVTGGAGFIGSHLCENLIRQRFNVVVVDNFDPFYPASQKEQNLSWLKGQPNFIFIKGDVQDQIQMATLFSDYKFDYVFHLAGRGGITQSTLNPFLYLNEIILSTMVILELSAKNNVKIFINASSSLVYGHMHGKKSSERTRTDKPLSVYAALKKSSELLCHAHHILYGIGIVNVRFFSVYGPRGRHDQVIYKITQMVDTETPIPIIFPEPRRDFTYIDDVVVGLVSLLSLPPQSYEIINFGRGKSEAISHVIELVERAFGKQAVLGEKINPLPSDAPATLTNSDRAKKILGWKPKIRIDHGISLFVEWYKKQNTGSY